MLTQANYRHVAEVMADAADLGADDRWLVTLPLFHANAQFYCFAPAIPVGASVGLTATFSASGWVDVATELGATCARCRRDRGCGCAPRPPAPRTPADALAGRECRGCGLHSNT